MDLNDSLLVCHNKDNIVFYRQGRELAILTRNTQELKITTQNSADLEFLKKEFNIHNTLFNSEINKKPGISDLETQYKDGIVLKEPELSKLIKILISERDCWLSNTKGLQKLINKQKESKP